jgi:hypothetical protein
MSEQNGIILAHASKNPCSFLHERKTSSLSRNFSPGEMVFEKQFPIP